MYFSVVSPWFFSCVLLAVTTGVQSKVQSGVRTKPSPGVNISPHIVPASPALMYTLPLKMVFISWRNWRIFTVIERKSKQILKTQIFIEDKGERFVSNFLLYFSFSRTMKYYSYSTLRWSLVSGTMVVVVQSQHSTKINLILRKKYMNIQTIFSYCHGPQKRSSTLWLPWW